MICCYLCRDWFIYKIMERLACRIVEIFAGCFLSSACTSSFTLKVWGKFYGPDMTAKGSTSVKQRHEENTVLSLLRPKFCIFRWFEMDSWFILGSEWAGHRENTDEGPLEQLYDEIYSCLSTVFRKKIVLFKYLFWKNQLLEGRSFFVEGCEGLGSSYNCKEKIEKRKMDLMSAYFWERHLWQNMSIISVSGDRSQSFPFSFSLGLGQFKKPP